MHSCINHEIISYTLCWKKQFIQKSKNDAQESSLNLDTYYNKWEDICHMLAGNFCSLFLAGIPVLLYSSLSFKYSCLHSS